MESRIICGDSSKILFEMPKECVDLTITSPPYDYDLKVREYDKDINWNESVFLNIVKGLYYITKPGGVVVWIVNDTTVNGSETGYSFKQALIFKENGWNLYDTMIYLKNSFAFPSTRRYHQVFEYCFIFVKPQNIIQKNIRFDYPIKKEAAAWLAAAIDGEGCFRIHRNGNLGSYNSNITVGNTNRDFVEKCRIITGVGNIWENKKHSFYEWNVTSDNVAKIISEIYPYLIIKKEQAKTIIEFQNMLRKENKTGGRNSRLSEKEKNERLKFFHIIKSLNQKEITSSGFPEPNFNIIKHGQPKTFNPIKDRENIYGLPWGKNTKRQKDGVLKEQKMKNTYEKFGMRHNVWKYNIGNGFAYPKNSLQKEHPASFPVKLVEDHVLSWSNEQDIILDPFAGSGTVCVVAKKLNRNYIGIEISEKYYDLIQRRLEIGV